MKKTSRESPVKKIKNIACGFPIYIIHTPFGQITYLYLFMPLMGLLNFIFRRTINKYFIPFYFIFLICLIWGAVVSDFIIIKRSILTILMGGFCQLLIEELSDSHLKSIIRTAFILFLSFFF